MNQLIGVAYARYSSDNQREESIDAQIRAINEFASRNNIIISKLYIDEARSATTDNRPNFLEMINDSSLQTFNVVIVHKLDRFARNRYDSAFYKKELKKNNVKVLSVLENLDDTPESVILESVLEGMAEYYSKNLSREVMKGMKETAIQCKHNGGTPPLGYDVLPDKTYTINPEEAKAVQLIFSMYLAGYGYGEIINELDNNCYKTKLGQRFKKTSLYSILNNEKYTGIYIFNKSSKKNEDGKRNSHTYKSEEEIIKIENGIPVIISKEDFIKAQGIMAKNKRTKASYRANETYILSGLVKCGCCGFSMVGNVSYSGRNKLKYVTYRCNNRMNNKKACINKGIRREYIEEFVLQQLEEKIFNNGAISYIVKQLNEHHNKQHSSLQDDLKHCELQISKTDNEINNIMKLVMQGFSNPTLINTLTELEQKKETLKIKLLELQQKQKISNLITEEDIKKILSVYKQYIHDRNYVEIKNFISQYVKEVIISEDYINVVFTLPLVVATYGGGEAYRTRVHKLQKTNINIKSRNPHRNL
ncbi:recombinase family protein [Clostridium butyricum]|uniref:recombinase family protein n=1 Tax=Clostridium butyricum TaxID=1492 RepID=UPI0002CAE6E6|nr:recombinase family protein [Clostridium butyricum]EMU52826.1 hypothetical protein CBDKU1_31980 [Clostridium butyricum DKU-01]